MHYIYKGFKWSVTFTFHADFKVVYRLDVIHWCKRKWCHDVLFGGRVGSECWVWSSDRSPPMRREERRTNSSLTNRKTGFWLLVTDLNECGHVTGNSPGIFRLQVLCRLTSSPSRSQSAVMSIRASWRTFFMSCWERSSTRVTPSRHCGQMTRYRRRERQGKEGGENLFFYLLLLFSHSEIKSISQ